MAESDWIEANIDGMIGPTHHYGGLGIGNIASQSHQFSVSSPHGAALEGLAKMELVAGRGIPQFVLPPPVRPNWNWLESVGCYGSHADMLKQCFDRDPSLLSAAYSSAFMWTANAATIAPALDTLDSKLRVLPANLSSNLHRGQEANERRSQLQTLFRDVDDAQILPALPSVLPLRDEGAANHMRLWDPASGIAIHVFVFGPRLEDLSAPFIGRQSALASHQVACGLRLPKERCIFLQQARNAIRAGVFHNDVIATSHSNLLMVHESAFENTSSAIQEISSRFYQATGQQLFVVHVREQDISLATAVETYLFNSQLLEIGGGKLELLCPDECRLDQRANDLIHRWIRDPNLPIDRVSFVGLKQSMSGGGGPACLRLRVTVHRRQLASMDWRFRLDEEWLHELQRLVEAWYPKRVEFSDLLREDFADHAIQAATSIEQAVNRRVPKHT